MNAGGKSRIPADALHFAWEPVADLFPPGTIGPPPDAAAAQAERLALLIERLIRRRTGGRIHALRVTIASETVVLHGHCTTLYCRDLAQRAARGLTAGKALTNSIEVR